MNTLFVECESINVTKGQSSVRFIVPAKKQVPNTDGKILVETVLQIVESIPENVISFIPGTTYAIDISEIGTKEPGRQIPGEDLKYFDRKKNETLLQQ